LSADPFDYFDTAAERVAQDRPVLQSLSEKDWEQVIVFAARRKYVSGSTIVAARETTRAIFIIISGTVHIETASPASLSRSEFGAGQVFGVETFLAGGERGAAAIAATPVELVMLTDDAFAQLAAWSPRSAIQILRDLASHVAARLAQFELPL
jgi:CRP-like cAMP-binding protein